MNNLEKAIEIAIHYHAGQVDKTGQPYILHPLRVMLSLVLFSDRIVAVLHDVIEDTDCTMDKLINNYCFSPKNFNAIDAISRPKGMGYDEYISIVNKNEIAKRVKIADLNDNLDPRRLEQLKYNEQERLYKKYTRALEQLKFPKKES